MDKYRFGNYLTALRTERGLSQSELGEIVGVSNKAISKWENGEALPRLERLKALADYFSITVEELINGGQASDEALKAEPDLTPRFGLYDEEERAEKEALSDAYFKKELRRAVWARRWTIITLLADHASTWLLLFPLCWLEYQEYRVSLPATMAGDVHPLGASIALCVLETLLILVGNYLIWRGYNWARWVRIVLNGFALCDGVLVLAETIGAPISSGFAVFYLVYSIINMLHILFDTYLFAFYRPVKDFLAEQREYYRS